MNNTREILTKRELKKQKRDQFIVSAIGWTALGCGGILLTMVWYTFIVVILGSDV